MRAPLSISAYHCPIFDADVDGVHEAEAIGIVRAGLGWAWGGRQAYMSGELPYVWLDGWLAGWLAVVDECRVNPAEKYTYLTLLHFFSSKFMPSNLFR